MSEEDTEEEDAEEGAYVTTDDDDRDDDDYNGGDDSGLGPGGGVSYAAQYTSTRANGESVHAHDIRAQRIRGLDEALDAGNWAAVLSIAGDMSSRASETGTGTNGTGGGRFVYHRLLHTRPLRRRQRGGSGRGGRASRRPSGRIRGRRIRRRRSRRPRRFRRWEVSLRSRRSRSRRLLLRGRGGEERSSGRRLRLRQQRLPRRLPPIVVLRGPLLGPLGDVHVDIVLPRLVRQAQSERRGRGAGPSSGGAHR